MRMVVPILHIYKHNKPQEDYMRKTKIRDTFGPGEAFQINLMRTNMYRIIHRYITLNYQPSINIKRVPL